MATFNESIFDYDESVIGDVWPSQHSSAIDPNIQDSPTDAGVTAGIACASLLGSIGALIAILAALRRRVDFVADLCDRVGTAFEALVWRQGTAPVPRNDSEVAPAPVAPGGCNFSDDSLIQLRRLTSQCDELRPDNEYV